MKMRSGTGISRMRDAAEAGREAAAAAVAGLAGELPALVIVFTTPRYDLPALLASIRSVTGDAHLIGATGSGEIVQGQHLGFGGGVGVLALTAGPYRFGVASADHIRGQLNQTGQAITRASRAEAGSSPHAVVLLLADCLAGDLQQLFQGAYRITGPKVSITGGAAGDELKFVRTCVFHDDRVVEEGAVALWIAKKYRVAPEPVAALVAEAYDVGRANKLDPTLILAVMAIESSFNPFAQSPVGAQGLMQVMTQIHSDKYEHFGGQYAAFDPKSNLRVGVKVLSEYVTRTGSVEGGLKWYVGAANLPTDGGYADKVMAEHSRLSQVAKGKTIPLTDNTPALRAATTPAPSAAPAGNAPVKVAALS